MWTSRPMSKNTREFMTKARYSQNDSNATLVVALIPFFAPKLPTINPADAVAMTPDKCR